MVSHVRELLLGTAHVERSRLLWWAGLRAGIVTGILVVALIVNDDSAYALPVAVGAIFAAIADAGETVGRRWRTMLWATTWLMFTTLLGGIGGNHVILGVLMVVPVAFVCGYAGALGPRAAVIGVLALVLYVVFNGAPESERVVSGNVLMVGLGGLVMTAVTVVPHLFRPGALRVALEPVPTLRERLRGTFNVDDNFVRHGVRLAILITLATIVTDLTSYPHDYWLPMTIAWVTKPDANGTASKIIARIVGTVAGVVITAVVVDWLGVSDLGIGILVGVAAAVTLTFIWANYALAVVGITFVVVGLFTFDGDPVAETLVMRILATILAGALAFAGFFIWPPVRKHRAASAAALT